MALDLFNPVQSSRWDEAIFLMNPGTSCLATIMLSLWDKYILPVGALIKLALMRLDPGFSPRGFARRLSGFGTSLLALGSHNESKREY